jgi:hypothetical protein
MNDSRLDRIRDRLQHSGRVRGQFLVLVALIFALGHTATFVADLGLSHRASRILLLVVAFAVLAFWLYRAQRINVGNVFTMQYHGWYRAAKLLERDRDLNTVLVRLYDEQYTDRPKRLNKSAVTKEDEAGAAKVISISNREFEACEPVVIFDGELNDKDREFLDNLPSSARVATVHY